MLEASVETSGYNNGDQLVSAGATVTTAPSPSFTSNQVDTRQIHHAQQTSNFSPEPQSQNLSVTPCADQHTISSSRIYPNIKLRKLQSIAPAPTASTAKSRVSTQPSSIDVTDRAISMRRTLTSEMSTYMGPAAANLFATQTVSASDIPGVRAATRAARYNPGIGVLSGRSKFGYLPQNQNYMNSTLPSVSPVVETGLKITRCQSVPATSTVAVELARTSVGEAVGSTPLPMGVQHAIATAPAGLSHIGRVNTTSSTSQSAGRRKQLNIKFSITNKSGRTQVTPGNSRHGKPMVNVNTPPQMHAQHQKQLTNDNPHTIRQIQPCTRVHSGVFANNNTHATDSHTAPTQATSEQHHHAMQREQTTTEDHQVTNASEGHFNTSQTEAPSGISQQPTSSVPLHPPSVLRAPSPQIQKQAQLGAEGGSAWNIETQESSGEGIEPQQTKKDQQHAHEGQPQSRLQPIREQQTLQAHNRSSAPDLQQQQQMHQQHIEQQKQQQQQSDAQVQNASTLTLNTPPHRPGALKHTKSAISLPTCKPVAMVRAASVGTLNQGRTPGSGTQIRRNFSICKVPTGKGSLQRSPANTGYGTPHPQTPVPIQLGVQPQTQPHSHAQLQRHAYPGNAVREAGGVYRSQEPVQALQPIKPRPLPHPHTPTEAGTAIGATIKADSSRSVIVGTATNSPRNSVKVNPGKTLPHARCQSQTRKLPFLTSKQSSQRMSISAPKHSTPEQLYQSAAGNRQAHRDRRDTPQVPQQPIRTQTQAALAGETYHVLRQKAKDVRHEIQRLSKYLEILNDAMHNHSDMRNEQSLSESIAGPQPQQASSEPQRFQPHQREHLAQQTQQQQTQQQQQQQQQHQQQQQQQQQQAQQQLQQQQNQQRQLQQQQTQQQQQQNQQRQLRQQQTQQQQQQQQQRHQQLQQQLQQQCHKDGQHLEKQQHDEQQHRHQQQQERQLPQQWHPSQIQQQASAVHIPQQEAQSALEQGVAHHGQASAKEHDAREQIQPQVPEKTHAHAQQQYTLQQVDNLSLNRQRSSQGTMSSPSSQGRTYQSAYPTPRQSQVGIDDMCSPFVFGNTAETNTIIARSTSTVLARSLTEPIHAALVSNIADSKRLSVSTTLVQPDTNLTDASHTKQIAGDTTAELLSGGSLSQEPAHVTWDCAAFAPVDTAMHATLDLSESTLEHTPAMELDIRPTTGADATGDVDMTKSSSDTPSVGGVATVLEDSQTARGNSGVCGDGVGATTSESQKSMSEACDTLLMDKNVDMSHESYSDLASTFNLDISTEHLLEQCNPDDFFGMEVYHCA